EDLWEFNEEIVARAIFHSDVPIVSAVGHEIDFTICDFVADLRAPTPSAAAELIVPDVIDLRQQTERCARALGRQLLDRVRDATLGRGYSITLDERGTIVRTVLAVRTKMKIRTRVSDGEFGSEIL